MGSLPRSLTDIQQSLLEKVIATFSSFEELGLGKTRVEQHVITVTEDNLPVKQKHYPISPTIQQLVYSELDRTLAMGVIEKSNSS